MHDDIRIITTMVRGTYDLQKLRIQTGQRLIANFRAKLRDDPEDEDEDAEEGELSERAEKILDMLRQSYNKLMEGVAKNRTLPAEEGFVGDDLISTHTELALNHNYFSLKKEEDKQFRLLEPMLDKIPIWRHWLGRQVGIGPAMGALIVSYLDPHKARYISSFWAYCGLDVAPDGFGRSKRKEHLVERTYRNKKGEMATRVGLTYQPFLRARLLGVVAGSFLRTGSPWRNIYDDYKHRIETDPGRLKIPLTEYKRRLDAAKTARDDDELFRLKHMWPPGRIDKAAKRYMVKMFLAELWTVWRELEGLPLSQPYAVAKLGRPPHRRAG